MNKTVTRDAIVRVRVTTETKELATRLARKDNRTLSGWISHLIAQEIKRQENSDE